MTTKFVIKEDIKEDLVTINDHGFADLLRRTVDGNMTDAEFRHLVRMNIAVVERPKN